MKHKSLLDPDLIIKLVGASMALNSWNFNLLGEHLALKSVASVDNSSVMEPRQKECIGAVMVIQVIRSQPLSPPPPDLSLHTVASGASQLIPTDGHQRFMFCKSKMICF